MNNSRKGGMAFVLAQTLLAQIQQDPTLISRINLIALIFSEVKAIIDAFDGKTINDDDAEHLQIVSSNIDDLRDSYEPIMDDPESRMETNSKRATAEKLLDITRYYLLYLIEKYKLVDYSNLKDITGVSWEAE